MQKWEYKVLGTVSESELKALGNAGWELVAVTANYGSPYYHYFKRPKS